MAKTKYLYATKVQLYMLLASLVFMTGIMGAAILAGGADAPPLAVVALTLGLMVALAFVMWKSYKGELPLMRIEER
jgi:hypothetical protein